MKEKITDTLIKTLTPTDTAYEINDTQEIGFCLIVRPSGVMSFCLRYRNADGHKRTFTIGKHGKVTVKQARDLAKKLNGQVSNGIDIQARKRQKKSNAIREKQQTLRVFFDEQYKSYALSHMKRGKDRIYILEHYFVEDWGDKALTDINQWLLTSWRKQQLNRGLKHSGVNRPISALKALLNRAVEWGVIDVNPIANVKPLREDPSPVVRYLSDEEESALRDALKERQEQQRKERQRYNAWRLARHLELYPGLDREYTDYLAPMVLLALNTGMRRGELFSLRLPDIDIEKRQIVIHGQTAKSGKTRHVPFADEGAHVLTSWCERYAESDTGLVFPSPVTGNRFDNINSAWQSLVKLAGLSKFRFHDLRHTYASKLVMRGAGLYVVKELLGHASIDTTQRYAHLAPDLKARTVELLNNQRTTEDETGTTWR